MILFTYRFRSGGTPPIRQIVRKGEKAFDQTTKVMRKGPFPIAEEILTTLETFKNQDVILYVAPGAIVRPPLSLLQGSYDVAARVQSIGDRPVGARPFSGVGKVLLDTLAFRNSPAAIRTLRRWADRLAASTVDPSVALAIALRETKAALLHLPEAYCWRESEDRPGRPAEIVAIDHSGGMPEPVSVPDAPLSTPKESVPETPGYCLGPGVLWSGHFGSYASYGKINREVLFRVANSLSVKIDSGTPEACLIDESTWARVQAHRSTLVSPRAPFLRYFGPDFRPPSGVHKTVWTMIETANRVHPDMVRLVNKNYDRLWVPTTWNAETFRSSGVRVPIEVIPLGINPLIYRSQKRGKLPPCRLVSTKRRGTVGVPSDFIFLSVGLISPRKGFEVVADALEMAFPSGRGIDFVIATTHASKGWDRWIRKHFWGRKIRVWLLEGRFAEHEMAAIYAASDVYVSASIGEGWGLGGMEAAAVGLPVVVPNNSSHPDVYGPNVWMFDPDGIARCPEVESVSPWYVGMEFSSFGERSRKSLAGILKHLKSNRSSAEVERRVELLCQRSIGMTWDVTADRVVRGLLEVQ